MGRLGKVGTLSDQLNSEFFLWEIVQELGSLSELKKWDMEDIEKFYGMIVMRRDYDKAVRRAAKPEKED